MIDVFKIMIRKYDSAVAPNMNRANPDIPTRGHQYKLAKVRANTALRKHYFTIRITDTWNNLPEKVISAPSLNAFKNRLDNVWKNQDILYDYTAPLNYKSNLLSTSRMQTDTPDPDLDTQD